MILILSDKNDVHADKVETILKAKSNDYFRFNIDVESLKTTFVKYNGDEWEVTSTKSNKNHFKTSDINVIWNRRTYVELLLEEQNKSDVSFKIWKGEWNKTLLGIYSYLEKKKWLNFYRDSYYAENKYRQFEVAKGIGFRTPKFVCSNDKDYLMNSFEFGKEKVIKFMNQDFYETSNGEFKGIYVNKVTTSELSSFKETGENPIILQDYIDKNFEVRYTVVGESHFVCKIDSQCSEIANTDWRRYDLANTPHSIIEPPNEIKDKVKRFMSTFNLKYGAFDFIVSKDNQWYFLELNSMGQFLWIEDLTGLQISNQIANWLISNNLN